jgi:GNAT superfamily N-acetyltransferase
LEVEVLRAIKASSADLENIKEIFFEASNKKEFSSEESKKRFFHTWCGQYLEKYPEHFLLAKKGGVLLGYCCAHPNSLLALEEFKVPGQSCFEEHFKDFPVHLHINCHKKSRGMGIGRILIESQAKNFKEGMHIITDKKADNYGFYQALGFNFEVESNFKGHSLLFMGRRS